MIIFLSNTNEDYDLFKYNKSLISDLSNVDHYPIIRSYISKEENDEGDYNYSDISNIGMVYLYIHRKGSNRKKETKTEYARELLQFLEQAASYGIKDIRSLKRSEIEAYQDWLTLRYPKTNTQAKKVSILGAFLTWCYKEKYIQRDLSRGLVSVQINKNQIPDRDIEESSVRAAIDFYSEDPKFKSLLLLLGSTGLRLNEIVTPKWNDLYFDSVRKKHYLRTKTKRDRIRHAHIKEYVLKELQEYRQRVGLNISLDPNDYSPFYPNRMGKHYLLTSLSSIVTKKLADAHLRTTQNYKTTAHFFRHFFARAAYNAGASVDRISKTLDHSSTRVTEENYLHRELKKEHDVSDYVDIFGNGDSLK